MQRRSKYAKEEMSEKIKFTVSSIYLTNLRWPLSTLYEEAHEFIYRQKVESTWAHCKSTNTIGNLFGAIKTCLHINEIFRWCQTPKLI